VVVVSDSKSVPPSTSSAPVSSTAAATVSGTAGATTTDNSGGSAGGPPGGAPAQPDKLTQPAPSTAAAVIVSDSKSAPPTNPGAVGGPSVSVGVAVSAPVEEKKSVAPSQPHLPVQTQAAVQAQTAASTASTPSDSKAVVEASPKKGSGVELSDGPTLFRAILNEEEQVGIVKACNALDTSKHDTDARMLKVEHFHRKKLPMPLLSINWNGDGKKVNIADDGGMFNFGKATYDRAQADGKTGSFKPDALAASWYMEGSQLAPYVPTKPGTVLLISVGCTAEFVYTSAASTAQPPQLTTVRLESGDVLVYNAAKWKIGISSLLPDTTPKFWKSLQTELDVTDLARFTLEFRDATHVAK